MQQEELKHHLTFHQILVRFGVFVLATSSGTSTHRTEQGKQLEELLDVVQNENTEKLSAEECAEIEKIVRCWKTEQDIIESFMIIAPPEDDPLFKRVFSRRSGSSTAISEAATQSSGSNATRPSDLTFVPSDM